MLIDEYDVPLAKAYENGYYDDMVLLLRNMFGNVLKSNDSLAFAVLTGCLRIAKESIFTGLNNFKVYSITDQEFDETFGFTDAEVKAMLQYYGLQDYFDAVREWYDGYRFGKVDVYCPWDVVNYCSDHRKNPDVEKFPILNYFLAKQYQHPINNNAADLTVWHGKAIVAVSKVSSLCQVSRHKQRTPKVVHAGI